VEVRVDRFQVSASEAAALAAGPANDRGVLARALAGGRPVQLFGHEFVGTVQAVGGGGSGLRPGMRVVSLGRIPCLACHECRDGREARCVDGLLLGIDTPGCFADTVHVPAHGLVVVPETLDDRAAAALQPFSSCIGCFAAAAGRVRDGAVAVLGAGSMGLFLIALAHMYGGRVFALARRPEIAAAARRAGADLVAATAEELEEQIATHASEGAAVVFEATGAFVGNEPFAAPLVDLAARIARPGGAVYAVGNVPGSIRVDASRFRAKSLTYVFPELASRDDLGEAVRLANARAVSVEASHVFEGLDALPEALAVALSKGENGVVGTVQVIV
jgi:threonine dehydrogenase-like Zn-dependent dehydrogenase